MPRKVLPVLLTISIVLLSTLPARSDEPVFGQQTLVPFKDLPPTLNKLLRQLPGVNPDPALRIACVGISPDPTDPRLQTTKRFRLHRSGPNPASSEDTQLAAWLSASWPDVTLVAVGLPKPDDKYEAWKLLRRGIESALDHNPQVLVLREDFLLFCRAAAVPRDGKDGVLQVFVECWKRACLPVIVTSGPESPLVDLPGTLHVHLLGRKVFEGSVRTEAQVAHADTPLGLPVTLLEDRPKGLDLERAALGYIGLATAALPAEGPLAHLDRAGSLWQHSSTRKGIEGDAPLLFRTFDIVTAFDPAEKKVSLFGASANVETELRGLKRMYNPKGVDGPPERKILMSVCGHARLSRLDAAAQLTHLRTVFLFPGADQGSAAFLMEPHGEPDSVGTVIQFWSAHTCEKGSPGNLLFNVQPNTPLKID